MTVEPSPIVRAATVHHGDCVAWLRTLDAESVDAIVTDPPYGLGFMGKAWDCSVPGVEWATECLRVLKPGGHLVAFGGTRTVHRLTCAIEDAGFEIRDSIGWVYFNGFPKSLDVSKAIDFARDDEDDVRVVCRWLRACIDKHPTWSTVSLAAAFGVHSRMVDHWAARDTDSQPNLPTWEQWLRLRSLLGFDDEMDARVWELNERKGTVENERPDRETSPLSAAVYGEKRRDVDNPGSPVTDEARRWLGWGTALKPSIEPAVLARKPLCGTVAANVLAHGTGALDIDGCRFAPGDPAWVGPDDGDLPTPVFGGRKGEAHGSKYGHSDDYFSVVSPLGRWPANLYACPKASRTERERGCEGLPERTGAEAVEREEGSAGVQNPRAGAGRTAAGVRNFHPTVKSVRLMRWLCRLVTPPGGLILDPFLGSGSTGVAATLEGFRFAGAEMEADYVAIARARMAHAARWPASWADTAPGAKDAASDDVEQAERAGQVSLFGSAA